jgi:3-methyladenine DNA glycosylase AlkD
MTKTEQSAFPALGALRTQLAAAADPVHAAFHQQYHKSELHFAGLRIPQLRQLWRELWPLRPRPARDAVLPLLDPLWASACYEETLTAIYLLSRIVPELSADDLPLLHTQTRCCSGWGQLDFLALEVLGPLALRLGAAAYAPVMAWLDDSWLWTRRAAVLIHCVPARRGELAQEFAWPSFASRLQERDFFIRKAVGWALRECCKRYPAEVAAFVRRHAVEMSGLTRREAVRNLPADLQSELLL